MVRFENAEIFLIRRCIFGINKHWLRCFEQWETCWKKCWILRWLFWKKLIFQLLFLFFLGKYNFTLKNVLSPPFIKKPQHSIILDSDCPGGWGCKIHRLHRCRGVRPHPNESPWYDTKWFDSEAPVILELWGMRSIPSSLPLLPGPLWPGMIASERALSMGLIKLTAYLC